MSKNLINIIGIGASGLDSLTPAKTALIREAEIIITAKRIAPLLEGISNAEIHLWPKPFNAMLDKIAAWKNKKIIVVATGDPMWHGVGSIIARHLSPKEYNVLPAPPAFSLAAARLGWPLSRVETLTLHGYSRPSSLIIPFIQPGARLLALTSGSHTVHEVAAHLVELGFGGSAIHVLEDMEEKTEKRSSLAANQFQDQKFSDFNTIGIECIANAHAMLLPRTPGLPDEAFNHDGQLTKQHVRAISGARLCPAPGQLLWDIGAGCGSIAIEWMRHYRANNAIAFEANPTRCKLIAENAENLGVPWLKIVESRFPDSLSDHPRPDAVFIGGGIALDGVFEIAWEQLKSTGRLVANCVTLEGQQKLQKLHQNFGGELTQIAISNQHQLGTKQILRPALPVLQWRIIKP